MPRPELPLIPAEKVRSMIGKGVHVFGWTQGCWFFLERPEDVPTVPRHPGDGREGES